MPTVLSTKKLTEIQQQLLLNSGLGWVHTDFISTIPINFEFKETVSNAIFTSKNAVNSLLSKGIYIKNAFCVGMRTKQLLDEKKISVTLAGKNGETLGNEILKQYPTTNFTYFCAVDRLDILPNILAKGNVKVKEVPVYKTLATPKKVNSHFDGVLFFSPSGVESFFKENELKGQAFCIGNTTATAVQKHTTNYTIASKTTVENVLVTAINYFKAL